MLDLHHELIFSYSFSQNGSGGGNFLRVLIFLQNNFVFNSTIFFRRKNIVVCSWDVQYLEKLTHYNFDANHFTCRRKWANEEDKEQGRNIPRVKCHSVEQWNKTCEMQFVYNQPQLTWRYIRNNTKIKTF